MASFKSRVKLGENLSVAKCNSSSSLNQNILCYSCPGSDASCRCKNTEANNLWLM